MQYCDSDCFTIRWQVSRQESVRFDVVRLNHAQGVRRGPTQQKAMQRREPVPESECNMRTRVGVKARCSKADNEVTTLGS